MRRSASHPIAVIALGAMFPGRGTTLGFFRDLIEGVDTISDVPPSHWRIEDYFDPDPSAPDKTYGRRGGFLGPQSFDPVKFGLPPTALPSTDTSQLLALMVADRIMSDVEAAIGGLVDRSRTSVVLGVASATELTGHMAARLQRPIWERALRQSGLDDSTVRRVADHLSARYTEWTEATFPGLLGNVVAGRIANRLDLGGSNFVTDAACASSLAALQVAMSELRAGTSDMALAGGVDALNDILMYLCFSKTPALSPTGDCRPFSDAADGTILGEGIGMVALKRLVDAERDGDRIHAVIKGIGSASDGRATAIYAPLPKGQATALRRAYDDAGYGPRTVGLMEAHGTGTQAGDKAELEGLHAVFAENGTTQRPWCAIGSVKSQIGHTKAAAGSASMIKAIMALSRKVIPPTIKVDRPAEPLERDTPFYLTTRARPWVRPKDHPRRASVSSFGFGGSDFHATLEAYEGDQQPDRHRLWTSELLLFSGASPDAVVSAIDRFLSGGPTEASLPRDAEALAAAFDETTPAAAYMLVRALPDLTRQAEMAKAALLRAESDRPPLPKGVGVRAGKPAPGKTAFLFAGQGSQYVGMGADLAMDIPLALEAWSEAAAHTALGPLKLHDLAFPPTAFTEADAKRQQEALTAMTAAQPSIAVTALSQLDVVRTLGLSPDMAGGHSFGELVALHVGGAINRDGLLSLSLARAEAMTAAAGRQTGAMLAVRADAANLSELLDGSPDLVLANDNSPSQVALSGTLTAIEDAERRLRSDGITVRRLPVAAAFHSPVVAEAVAPFDAAIERVGIVPPAVPVYANTTARPYGSTDKAVRTLLANQIRQTVRFRDMLDAMYRDGARTFIEFGPGSVVSGLAADCLGDRDVTIVALDQKKRHGTEAFLEALGTLAISGHRLDFGALYRENPHPPVPEPPGRFAVEICGANLRRSPSQKLAAETTNRKTPASPPTGTAQPTPADPMPTVTDKSPIAMTHAPAPQQPHAGQSSLSLAIAEVSAAHRQYLETISRLAGLQLPQAEAAPAKVAAPPAPQANGHASPPNGHLNGSAHARANGNGLSPDLVARTPVPKEALSPVEAPMPASALAEPAFAVPDVAEASVAEAPAGAAAPEIVALLKTVIAEKTGYPEEMLETDMHLEAELGIDSIKQVEILSALRDVHPGLPDIDPEVMSDMTTIERIAQYVSGQTTVARPQQSVSRPQPTAPTRQKAVAQVAATSPAPNATTDDLRELLKSLIAEKTGYPTEMLEDDMDLESELGVDSIKQVEILSALREARPGLPDVDPEQIAELRSIADLADFFQ